MNTVRIEDQQNQIPSKKPRLLKPFERGLLVFASFLLIVELYTTYNHNKFYSRVTKLEVKWNYAHSHHASPNLLPAFQLRLAKLEAKHFGPFPASWFPQIDGLNGELRQLETDTNKFWIPLAAKKKQQTITALSKLQKTEGAGYPGLEKKYQASLQQASEPQDYDKLTKEWTTLSKNWIEAQIKLKNVSGGMIENQPADITKLDHNLTGLLKQITHPSDVLKKAQQVQTEVEQYDQATPIEQLQQHEAIKAKLNTMIKKLEKATAPQKINVPLINQLKAPQLYNGCEVTSLAMILQFAGYHVSKNELAKKIPKEPVQYKNGLHGNPNQGFVGDITGSNPGYFVYHGPLSDLAKKYAGKKVTDLTGSKISVLYQKIDKGIPVLVYTTSDFARHPTHVWKTPQGKVKISENEHCVVLTGYSKDYVWVNNPYGIKSQKVSRSQFEKSWRDLGRQAIVINK